MPTSKLFWNEEKKQFEVEITSRKGNQVKMSCDAPQLSADLPKTLTDDEVVEVEFERDAHGSPIRVRAAGKHWIEPKVKTRQTDYSRRNTTIRKNESGSSDFIRDSSKSNDDEGGPMSGDFHNPYNFVPAVPRNHIDGKSNEMGDREPSGHDRYLSDKFSGKLSVRMTVETPLIVLDTARVELEGDHKMFQVRVDADGQPNINPTTIKGMLRSAYEAVTNSRLSVFTKHEARLAFRPEAGRGAFVVPVRIEEEDQVKRIAFYTGTNKTADLTADGAPKNGMPLCAAWLPSYKKSKNEIVITYPDGGRPQHKDEVRVWFEQFRHHKWKWTDKQAGIGRFTHDFNFWRVREIVKKGDSLGSKPSATPNIGLDKAKELKKSYYESTRIVEEATGYVFVSNHNMTSKHDEKVFFKNPESPVPAILSDEIQKAWKELVENYRAGHEKIKGKLEPVSEKLGISEWSRHIQLSEKEKDLEVGTLCFAEVEKQGNTFTVRRLFPVMISRQLYDCSPFDLLHRDLQEEDLRLTPAELITQLSPADRVFGWARQSKSKREKTLFKDVGAYRGQLRFGEVTTERTDAIEDFGEDWLPLNILGQPKPQQGRFYVAETPKGEAQDQNANRNNKEAGYEPGRGLRGRKVYPHQNSLPDSYWIVEDNLKELPQTPFSQQELNGESNKGFFREYIRLTGEKQRDNQNRSIQGWVRKDTVFQFDVHFINLSKAELGALIWLLRLNGENENRYFHRFGGAKPFGLGSVKLNLDQIEISSGDELRSHYLFLADGKDKSQPSEAGAFVEAFQKELLRAYKFTEELPDDQIRSEFEEVSFIAAFKRACEGIKVKNDHRTDLPVHYPRTTSEPWRIEKDHRVVNESFKWFVANNRSARLPLPDLTNDEGLPYFERG